MKEGGRREERGGREGRSAGARLKEEERRKEGGGGGRRTAGGTPALPAGENCPQTSIVHNCPQIQIQIQMAWIGGATGCRTSQAGECGIQLGAWCRA